MQSPHAQLPAPTVIQVCLLSWALCLSLCFAQLSVGWFFSPGRVICNLFRGSLHSQPAGPLPLPGPSRAIPGPPLQTHICRLDSVLHFLILNWNLPGGTHQKYQHTASRASVAGLTICVALLSQRSNLVHVYTFDPLYRYRNCLRWAK